MGLRARNKDEKYSFIKEYKVKTPVEALVEGYPREFVDYLIYVKNLGFNETPDYSYLRRLFKELYIRCNFENGLIFDWTLQRYNPRVNTRMFKTQLGLKESSAGSDENQQ